MDFAVFVVVVSARVFLPLLIFRFPLPAILACLVVDGLDQTIFQTFTSLDLTGYQSYDKALDIYYLTLAYVATLRNWTNLFAVRIARFLLYYRLVGVVLFELTDQRWLLMVFPNTFEYFFIAYETVRIRWDPRRMSSRLLIGITAFIWIVIKLPQEWWIHVAQLDATDVIKEYIFGVPTTATWAEAIAARPMVIVMLAVALIAAAILVRWLLRYRLPPADRPPTFDADERQPAVPVAAIERERRRIAARVIDRELGEKILLVSLVSIVFGQMLPEVAATPTQIAIGVGLVILANAAISEGWSRRRSTDANGWDSAVTQFLAMLVVNVLIVIVGGVVLGWITGSAIEHAAVFVLLLTLIVTAYDRYRPIHAARFATA